MGVIELVKNSSSGNWDYLRGNPLSNGYGSASTASEIAADFKSNVKGKVFLITGCNGGIGKETVRALVENEGRVVMACRNMESCEATAKELRQEVPNADITTMHLDISSFESIRGFVKRFEAMKLSLDVLINNAGVMACPFRKTKDGHELQFGTNHLGHFLLTELLLPKLKESASSRIVIVSSIAHARAGEIRFDKFNDEKSYDRVEAYGLSKLANILHAKDLNQRMAKDGITVNALHPGVIMSDLYQHIPLANLVNPLFRPFQKSTQQGAATTVYLACAPQVEGHGGDYYVDCNPAESVVEEMNDQSLWETLRRVSLELTGLQ